MRLPSWLRHLAARLNHSSFRRAPRRSVFRPRVEGLEDRTVPSVNVLQYAPFANNALLRTTDAAGNLTVPEAEAIEVSGQVLNPSQQALQSGITYSWTVTKNGLPYASRPGTDQGPWTFTPDDDGTYVATLTATDADGTGSANLTIDVTNVPPNPLLAIQGQAGQLAGDLDPTFGTGGTVATVPTIENAVFAQQLDGNIIVAGGAYVRTEQINGGLFKIHDFAVFRDRSDGTLDPSFGTNGVTTSAGATATGMRRRRAPKPSAADSTGTIPTNNRRD
jgi:hypothetical protein